MIGLAQGKNDENDSSETLQQGTKTRLMTNPFTDWLVFGRRVLFPALVSIDDWFGPN